jgi:hypothetical protein
MREDMVRVGMGTADIRHRAEFETWGAMLRVQHNANVLSAEQVISLFEAGGFGVGIGDWRPEKDGVNGRFHVARAGRRCRVGEVRMAARLAGQPRRREGGAGTGAHPGHQRRGTHPARRAGAGQERQQLACMALRVGRQRSAAEQHRLGQAGESDPLNHGGCQPVERGAPKHVRAFVSVERDDGAVLHVDPARDGRQGTAAAGAWRRRGAELLAVRQKYAGLEELARVFAAIDEAQPKG